MESIRTAVQPEIDVRGFDRCLFGDFAAWESLPSELRAQVYLSAPEMPKRPTLVMGHFAYTTLRARYPRKRLATVLREPTARLLSHFVYWRGATDDNLACLGSGWGSRVATARGRLCQFLQNPTVACQTDNVVTRMLLWPHPLVSGGGFIEPKDDRALYDVALARINRFSHVDIVENEAGLYPNFSRWLGVPLVPTWINETPNVPEHAQAVLADELDAATRALIKERSRLDLMLWQTIAGRHFGPSAVSTLQERSIARCFDTLGDRLAGRRTWSRLP